MKRSLTKKERIVSETDIKVLLKSDSRYSCRGMKLITRSTQNSFVRFLVVPARGHGNSVKRNKSKRHGRELLRTNKRLFCEGTDVGLILYPGEFSFSQRLDQFSFLLRRSGIVRL